MRISDWSSDVCSSDLWSCPFAWHRRLNAALMHLCRAVFTTTPNIGRNGRNRLLCSAVLATHTSLQEKEDDNGAGTRFHRKARTDHRRKNPGIEVHPGSSRRAGSLELGIKTPHGTAGT